MSASLFNNHHNLLYNYPCYRWSLLILADLSLIASLAPQSALTFPAYLWRPQIADYGILHFNPSPIGKNIVNFPMSRRLSCVVICLRIPCTNMVLHGEFVKLRRVMYALGEARAAFTAGLTL